MQLSTIALAVETQTPAMGAIGSGSVRLLSPYDPLFREGDETTGFYEILSGAVRAYKIFPDGRRQIVDLHWSPRGPSGATSGLHPTYNVRSSGSHRDAGEAAEINSCQVAIQVLAKNAFQCFLVGQWHLQQGVHSAGSQ